MEINRAQFNKVVADAKAKVAGNKRWIAAIDAAVKGLMSGKWVVTELASCVAVTTESEKTYYANDKHCQCESFFYGKPCRHRAAARLIALYNEVADKAATSPRIVRSVESDRTGVKCVVVRCDGWMV